MVRLPRFSAFQTPLVVLRVQKVLGPVVVKDLSSSRFSACQRVQKTSRPVKEGSEALWSLLVGADNHRQ